METQNFVIRETKFSDYEYFPYFVQALKIRFGQQEEG